MALNWFAGYVVDTYHSYTPVFVVAGTGHLVGSLILLLFLRDGAPAADVSRAA
jgi:hypothetical protein